MHQKYCTWQIFVQQMDEMSNALITNR